MYRLICLTVFVLAACGAPSRAEPAFNPARADIIEHTDAEWKSLLDGEEYRILRQKGTERAFTGKYWNSTEDGVYQCAACGLPLFSSSAKFKSGTGWPSFTKPVASDTVGEARDNGLGMPRTEILCNRCGGHLGHVFPDGPAPTGLRYCVNGNALDFHPGEQRP
jgi:peptide-methionine (R)-S-oxide reductase